MRVLFSVYPSFAVPIRVASIICLLWIASSDASPAQSAQVTGEVSSREDGSPAVGATVRLEETPRGAVVRADGWFAITSLAAGVYSLQVTSIGFAALDTVFRLRAGDSIHLVLALEPDEHEAEEVVVTGTRTQRSIDDVPVRVEAVPQEEVEEKILMSPSNVAMLLNESQGMRVQTTSPTTATANLRIGGLPGRYTQVLSDGVPNVGGLSAGFGLTELPPLNLRQVEIIKGAASALYGADAIAGVVNFITKDPRDDGELSALVNVTSQNGLDLAVYAGKRSGDVGMTLMASRNTQPRVDVDDDGFADVTEVERYTIYPKAQYAFSDNVHAELGLGFISDDRVGGSATASRDSIGRDAPYLEHVNSRRLSGNATMNVRIDERQSLSFKGAALRLTRESTYGTSPFDANQSALYGEAVYSADFDMHSLLVGAAYSSDEVRVTRSLASPVGPLNLEYSYSAPGLFAQDELRFNDELTLLASARVDVHNTFGTFVTPRASLMYRPSEALTMRVGGGTGFKAPTIFIEEAEEAGFQNIELARDAVAERAQSGTFDVNWKSVLGDEIGLSVNAAAYLSRVQHALVVEPNVAIDAPTQIRNADGSLMSRAGELTAKVNYADFKLSLGYTYIYATLDNAGDAGELALNPRHSVGGVLMYESEDNGLKIGFETYWTGVQKLDDHPTRTSTPPYFILGLLAEKAIGPVRLFINFENFTDTRQTRYERIVSGDVQAGRVRALPIYAPLEGRVINGGIRFVL